MTNILLRVLVVILDDYAKTVYLRENENSLSLQKELVGVEKMIRVLHSTAEKMFMSEVAAIWPYTVVSIS